MFLLFRSWLFPHTYLFLARSYSPHGSFFFFLQNFLPPSLKKEEGISPPPQILNSNKRIHFWWRRRKNFDNITAAILYASPLASFAIGTCLTYNSQDDIYSLLTLIAEQGDDKIEEKGLLEPEGEEEKDAHYTAAYKIRE